MNQTELDQKFTRACLGLGLSLFGLTAAIIGLIIILSIPASAQQPYNNAVQHGLSQSKPQPQINAPGSLHSYQHNYPQHGGGLLGVIDFFRSAPAPEVIFVPVYVPVPVESSEK